MIDDGRWYTDSQGQRSKSEIMVSLLIQNIDIHNASSQIHRGRLQNFDTTEILDAKAANRSVYHNRLRGL